jgi:hypothetical protein
MGITKEIWVDYIIANLFKDNQFMDLAYNDDQYVLEGKVVHIPQAGAKPNVVKNRVVYPAAPTPRVDVDITYVLDEYTTDPTHIPNAETIELSYPKIDSVLSEHLQMIMEKVADNMLYAWSPTVASQIITTSGGAVAATLSGATGNRKMFLKEDLSRARLLMNTQNIPKTDRFALVESNLLDQLLSDSDLKKRDYAGELDMRNGAIARLYGFDILERSATGVYDNTNVIKPVGAAGSATDNASVLCWQKNTVARALGTVNFFERLKDPEFFGDIYSALLRMGGRKRRTNGEGVIAIVQGLA